MRPILHHDLIRSDGPAPRRWMLLAAGIFGTGRNWAGVARRFVRTRPEWGCVSVDLRQHGDSMGFPPPHTIRACADDLMRLCSHLDAEVGAVLGHSFGGKVALAFAEAAAGDAGAPFIERVWVVDSTPAAGGTAERVRRMIEVLGAQTGPFASRDEGVAAVREAGFAAPVARWMSSNLVAWRTLASPARERWRSRTEGPDPSPEELVWRLDPDDMDELLDSFVATDLWPVVEHPPPGTEVHLVKAADSQVLDAGACDRIEAVALATGAVHLHRVEGGHWLNADNPDALHRLLVEHMP
jgi:pimeloyl-ACP methyl ester carboxylesterase